MPVITPIMNELNPKVPKMIAEYAGREQLAREAETRQY